MFIKNLIPQKRSARYGMFCSIFMSLYVLLAGAPGAWADPKVIDRIAAVVNDEVISLFELNQEMLPYLERMKSLGIPPSRKVRHGIN